MLRLLAECADFCFSTQLFKGKIYLSLSFQRENAPSACGKAQEKICGRLFVVVMFVLLSSTVVEEPNGITATSVQ